jgi:hypothetical protein
LEWSRRVLISGGGDGSDVSSTCVAAGDMLEQCARLFIELGEGWEDLDRYRRLK